MNDLVGTFSVTHFASLDGYFSHISGKQSEGVRMSMKENNERRQT